MEIDLSRLDRRMRETLDGQFKDNFHRALASAVVNQTKTAKARQHGVTWKDDFGPQDAEINPVVDTLWRQVYGHNYTENPDVMRFLKRRNPEIAIRARSGKTMVGYTGKTGCRFGRGTMTFAK